MMEKILNSKWLKIGLLAFAGLVLAGGLVWAGYWYGINSNLKTSREAGSRSAGQNLTPTLTPLVTSLPTLPPEALSSPLPSEAPAKEGDETAGWKTYANENYMFSFKYPLSVTVEESLVPTRNYVQVIVNKNLENSFTLKADKEYQPADAIYFLDTRSTEQRTIGDYTWKIYFLPNGYGDGPEPLSKPIYGLQLEQSGILYTITLFNRIEPSTEQIEILSTFKFLD